jgi:hypothetical protein
MLKRSLLYTLGLFQILFFLAASVKPALAYVDPGSGLLFFQVGGSMLAGALFVLRAKVRKLFTRGSAPEPNTDLKQDDPNAPGGVPAGMRTGTSA